tara:strand:+ start:9324 stop:10862 length:1539 start_codon:yes stop_codon:yes gene_type:complete
MSFLGAGFAIGAARAVTGRLKDKKQKEEARFAFIKEAVDKGLSEFETQARGTKTSIESLYKRAEDHVLSKGLHQDLNKLSKDEQDILNSELGAQGINLYVKDVDGNNMLNPNLYDAGKVGDSNKTAVIKGLSKIGLKKILEAQQSPNFDIDNASHVAAILDARLGTKGRFKAAATRNVLADGKLGEYTNREVISTGFSPENYVSQPVEKIGLGKRISNFFNPMDEKDAIAKYAKDNNMSIAQTEKLFRAGQTEAMDAFTETDLEGMAGSIYGDLPDLTLRNIQTLIPTDAKTVEEINSFFLQQIAENTLQDAIYKDPDLPLLPENIKFNGETFTGKDGNPVSNDTIKKIYKDIITGQGTQSLVEVLPGYNEGDIRHRNDKDNVNDIFKNASVVWTAARGKDTQNVMDNLNNAIKNAGLPSIDSIGASAQGVNPRDIASAMANGGNYLYTDDLVFGFQGSTLDERRTVSEVLNEIMNTLSQKGVPSESLVPMAHQVLSLYLLEEGTTQNTLTE